MYNHQEDEDGASCIDALKLSSPDSSWVPAKQLIPPGRKSSIVICEDTSPCHQPFVFTASSLFKQRRSLSFNNLVDMAEQESKEEKDILLESSDDMFGLFSWSHSHHERKKSSMDMAINTFSKHRRSSLLEKLQSLQESEVMFPLSKDHIPAKQLIPPGRKSSIDICEDTGPCHQPCMSAARSSFNQRRSLSFNNLVDLAEQESREEKNILLESSDDMFGLFSWSHSHHGRKKRSMDMAINTFSEHRRSSLLEKLQSLQESEVMFPVSKDQSPSISRVIDKKRDKESPEKLTKVKKSERKHLGGIRGKEKATPRTKDIHSLFTW